MTDDPNAIFVGFGIILMSLIGGVIVSVIPDPVGIIVETSPIKDNPDVQKTYETYEKADKIYTAGGKAFMSMKFIGQFALFLGFPSAIIVGLAKS